MAKYKRSTLAEIQKRNAEAYKGTKEMQDAAKEAVKKIYEKRGWKI